MPKVIIVPNKEAFLVIRLILETFWLLQGNSQLLDNDFGMTS